MKREKKIVFPHYFIVCTASFPINCGKVHGLQDSLFSHWLIHEEMQLLLFESAHRKIQLKSEKSSSARFPTQHMLGLEEGAMESAQSRSVCFPTVARTSPAALGWKVGRVS